MKKFYTLIAFVATMLAANAFNPASAGRTLKANPRQAEFTRVESSVINDIKSNFKPTVASRADLDLTSCTQFVYSDAFNGYDSSFEMSIEVDGETVTFKNFFYNDFNFTGTITEKGTISVKLGQTFAKEDGYTFKLVSYDFNKQSVTKNGTIEFEILESGIVFDGLLGIYVTQGLKDAGWQEAGIQPMIMVPNATISYDFDGYDSNGNIVPSSCNNDIFAFVGEAETEEGTINYIFLSNVVYINAGTAVIFYIDELGPYAQGQVAYCEYDYDNEEYIDYYMCTANENDEPEAYVEGEYLDTMDGIKWGDWFIMSQDGSWFGQFYEATVRFKGNDDPSGIMGIESESNAPAVYYNLQGMQVANPTNGIFIKRQGNKATKVAL